MAYEDRTLGSLLSAPIISRIADDAIRNRDLRREDLWNRTLDEIRKEEFFSGDIGKGMERLYRTAAAGEWYYPLYSEEECLKDEARRGVNLVFFPSDKKEADDRPFILLVPGGGFVNVWNLTEGWPVAAEFNSWGYHVFILTYQVAGEEGLLKKNMEDFARALKRIAEKEARLPVRADRYITCGFSAGGYLVCLWNTEMGYPHYQLPKPEASFPIYPLVSPALELKELEESKDKDAEDYLSHGRRLYGCPLHEAVVLPYEIPEHAEGFPPCAIFLAAEDDKVSPEHSRLLARTLEIHQIPCRLEIGPTGGHGFADGSGMCMEGWTKRAVRWYESLRRHPA